MIVAKLTDRGFIELEHAAESLDFVRHDGMFSSANCPNSSWIEDNPTAWKRGESIDQLGSNEVDIDLPKAGEVLHHFRPDQPVGQVAGGIAMVVGGEPEGQPPSAGWPVDPIVDGLPWPSQLS